jgi:hypothetical protein
MDTLPASWSQNARDTYDAVTEERPDLSAADLAALYHACRLESTADALDVVAAAAAGYVATGSTGQVVAHPATVEARLARTAAASILQKLRPPAAHGTPTERAQRAARARWGQAK